ncbi:MAG TPA: hypothetical protein PKL73_13320 [Polyangiaceae bacterium]|jgi:5'(3')-deoxyribonucleotidase|nr:MAG: putative 5'(3')-deoxyribonucleotidase [Deltaproteobacteria bacterium ADurb.Bin207]HNS97924.1 hypothetical protein [Polyangiaceae bacterium]HNZ21739.1 hypothetical protein [Polyangiaceae bacterium]HOD21594.1 hypothetical protein [Polyangiaceae bacterium]HOE50566.1 hypothetical protein [Polyangiaceae bacterium]
MIHPQPVIGLDVDGVLADLVQAVLDAVHQRTGKRFFPEDVQRFDLKSTLGELWTVAHDVLTQPDFVRSLPPYPYAIEGVHRLRQLGRVVFVTTPFAPNPTWSHERSQWLEHHTGAPHHDIAHITDKTLFCGHLLIDDSPAQLQAWTATQRPAIRVVRPWNHDAPGLPARDWNEIVALTAQLLDSPSSRQDPH